MEALASERKTLLVNKRDARTAVTADWMTWTLLLCEVTSLEGDDFREGRAGPKLQI
jgi:hypothetical protein